MGTIHYYNLEKLIRISVFDKQESGIYYYTEKKFWGFVTKKACFRNWIGDEVDKSDLSNFIIENNIVYEKPECKLDFVDKYKKSYEFDTYDEALQKAEEIKLQCEKRNIFIEILK